MKILDFLYQYIEFRTDLKHWERLVSVFVNAFMLFSGIYIIIYLQEFLMGILFIVVTVLNIDIQIFYFKTCHYDKKKNKKS